MRHTAPEGKFRLVLVHEIRAEIDLVESDHDSINEALARAKTLLGNGNLLKMGKEYSEAEIYDERSRLVGAFTK